jgi:D-alanyl-D-alanine carboxypeptidase/D-alanyl-D-alanine-endopeptidase (penicillin-binding protein 4)
MLVHGYTFCMMRSFGATVWGAALMLSAGAAWGQGSAAALCDQVKALTMDPAVAAAHWGVSVTAMDGRVLCSLNEAQLFRPASNNKLFTLAAALALLGPERRFTTKVVAEGTLEGGVLKGNLRLVGGGDANFGSADVPYVEPAQRSKTPSPELPTIADIEEMADQIYAKGVRSISGDVIGDDGYFVWEPYPIGWEVEDLNAGFGAPVSALTIHDSELEMDVAPDAGKAGQPAEVSTFPDVAYYLIQNAAVTSASVQEARAHLRFIRQLGSKEFSIAGDIPLNAPVVKAHAAIQDPAEYAALALKEALVRRGIQVGGAAVAKHTVFDGISPPVEDNPIVAAQVKLYLSKPGVATACEAQSVSGALPAAPTTVLATHQSPRLADDVVFTAKESQNLHAEVLFRDLGANMGCDTTPHASLTIMRAYVEQAGIAGSDLVEYDGSGLSGHDLVTPRALTQLLVYAAKEPWFGTFRAALPVGGVDGTLRNRFAAPKSGLTGRVFAKTGTLGESRDLAGYVSAASGKTVVFAVMVDNHRPGGTADEMVMDKIVEAIAAGN